MATTQTSKVSRQGRLRMILSGIDKHFPNVTSIKLGGVVFTLADLKKLIQDDIDASDTSVQTKALWRAEVQLERNAHARVNPVLRMLKYFVLTQFGETQDAGGTLADFGYSPRKLTNKTLATKTTAVAQNLATRVVRHTMGKKQKAKVKGTVPKTTTSGSQPSAAPAGGTTPPKPTQPT